MYTSNRKQLIKDMGHWLGQFNWDYFSTITYRYDIKPRRNEIIMLDLEKSLTILPIEFQLFWVMEHTSNNYQTHNHLLLKGKGIQTNVNNYFKSKGLVDMRFVKHLPYKQKLGANYYICKYVGYNNIEYGMCYSKSNVLK
jgi:hypothetical protein